MRTSDRLPEECREEIRESIRAHEGAIEIMTALKADRLFIHAAERDIANLKWVLGEGETAGKE
jgi:hypothetical protein